MDLRIQNVGPLRDVTLPVRSLNVIIGPNHQGKTWLAYLLYGLAEILGSRRRSKIDLSPDALAGDPAGIAQVMQAMVHQAVATMRGNVRALFQDSSGVFERGHVSLQVPDQELVALFGSATPSIVEDGRMFPRGSTSASNVPPLWDPAHLQMYCRTALKGLLGSAFALPAERNALILIYKLLTLKRTRLLRDMRRFRGVELDGPDRIDDARSEQVYRELGEPRFPQPVEDFLDFLNEVEVEGNLRPPERTPRGRGYARAENRLKLADTLEASMLSGQRLHWEPTGLGGRELMLQVGHDRPLDLHNASSAVKQIAPLLLWLRSGRAQNLLIVDEPELNLHPVAQAQLLEGLAILVSSGVRVVLTTHSPYLLSHLNNLIAGHPSDQALRKRQAGHLYLNDPRAFLTPAQVGAWQLDQGELRDLYDPEWGIRSDTLSDAAEEIQRRYFAIRALETTETVPGKNA